MFLCVFFCGFQSVVVTTVHMTCIQRVSRVENHLSFKPSCLIAASQSWFPWTSACMWWYINAALVQTLYFSVYVWRREWGRASSGVDVKTISLSLYWDGPIFQDVAACGPWLCLSGMTPFTFIHQCLSRMRLTLVWGENSRNWFKIGIGIFLGGILICGSFSRKVPGMFCEK